MKKLVLVLILAMGFCGAGHAQTAAYDKEQVKRDYKAFLEQLKLLNAQYKEITGEMGKVIKEEGVPTWDMGKGLDLAPDKKMQVQDLGGGAYLKEIDREMVLTVDLPGYKKDSIKLSFKDGKTLSIQAERKVETIDRSFERSFDLPVPGDQRNAQATYADDVLTVKIPKIASQEVVVPVS